MMLELHQLDLSSTMPQQQEPTKKKNFKKSSSRSYWFSVELLVKCERIYFCANVRIWIDLGEKYGTKFALLIYYPKIVDF